MSRELGRPEPGTWETFLRAWRPRDLSGFDESELRDVPLPPPLRRYYASAGRLPTFNLHLVPPSELAASGSGDHLFFIHEEQGVYSFATRGDSADPPVWVVEDERWERLGEPLSLFLLQYVLFEAGGAETPEGGAGGWGYVSRAAMGDFVASTPELPLAPWPVPARRTAFHAGEDLVAVSFDDDREQVEVHVTARRAAALASLAELVDWDADPFGAER